MKSAAPKAPMVSRSSSLKAPVTVLSKPTRVVVPQPKVTTFANPAAVSVSKTSTLTSLTIPPKTSIKTTATAAGFKRPASVPRPAPRPACKPVEKSVQNFVDNPVRKSVENPSISSIALEKESENEKPLKKYAIAKHKVWAGLAFAGFALAITGFLVYLNLPDISVRVRATELGISTNLPAFKPSGYNVNGIAKVENETLMAEYTSGDDSYIFTARKSSFDSYQVADYAKSIFGESESVFGSGLTIYVKDHDAIWTNGGVLYTIYGSAKLTTEDITKIAIATE
jgi:hypothetical protein